MSRHVLVIEPERTLEKRFENKPFISSLTNTKNQCSFFILMSTSKNGFVNLVDYIDVKVLKNCPIQALQCYFKTTNSKLKNYTWNYIIVRYIKSLWGWKNDNY